MMIPREVDWPASESGAAIGPLAAPNLRIRTLGIWDLVTRGGKALRVERPVSEVDLATLTIGTVEEESGPEGEGEGEGEGELERDDSEDAGDVHGGTLFRVPDE